MSWEKYSARAAGRIMLAAVFGVSLAAVGGCKSDAREHQYPEQVGGSEQHDPLGHATGTDAQVGSMLDKDGLIGGLMDRGDKDENAADENGDGGESEAPEDTSGDADAKAAPAAALAALSPGETEEQTAAAQAAGGDSGSQAAWEAAQRHDPKKIGVNGYLWRATLETLSFMPLSSADPYGGVIITDWRTNPQAPNERVKVTVYILDKKLRADGVRVSVFRQRLAPEGVWVDQPATDQERLQIEEAILIRARQLRVADISED